MIITEKSIKKTAVCILIIFLIIINVLSICKLNQVEMIYNQCEKHISQLEKYKLMEQTINAE